MSLQTEDEGKLDEVKTKLLEYWNAVTSFPFQEDGKVVWDKSKESTKVMKMIVDYAQLLARLRGYVPTDKTEGTSGSNYGFLEPIIESRWSYSLSQYQTDTGWQELTKSAWKQRSRILSSITQPRRRKNIPLTYLTHFQKLALSKPSCNVFLGEFVLGINKERISLTEFY